MATDPSRFGGEALYAIFPDIKEKVEAERAKLILTSTPHPSHGSAQTPSSSSSLKSSAHSGSANPSGGSSGGSVASNAVAGSGDGNEALWNESAVCPCIYVYMVYSYLCAFYC